MTSSFTAIGKVGKDAEVKQVNNFTVATWSLAVNRGKKDSSGNWVTDWFQVELWGKLAEKASENVVKGANCFVTGKIGIDKYTSNGTEKQLVKIFANSYNIIPSGNNNNQSQGQTKPQQKKPAPKMDYVDDFEDDTPPF